MRTLRRWTLLGLGLLSMAVIPAGCGSHLSAWSYQYSGITWHRVTYVASKAYLRNPGRQLGTWANFAMPDYNIFAVPGESPSQAICLQTSKGYLLLTAK